MGKKIKVELSESDLKLLKDAKKKKDESSAAAGAMAVIFGLLFGLFVFMDNVISLKTISDFSFQQYFENIKHFHVTKTVYLKHSQPLVSEIGDGQPILSLKKGQWVKYRGYRESDGKYWYAITVYNSDDQVNGYFSRPANKNLDDYYFKEVENPSAKLDKLISENKGIALVSPETIEKKKEVLEKKGFKQLEEEITYNNKIVFVKSNAEEFVREIVKNEDKFIYQVLDTNRIPASRRK
jgi:hypothetical protein